MLSTRTRGLSSDALLELRDVAHRYPNTKKPTLSDVNLTIRYRDKITIVGDNGTGKTTLLRMIAGGLEPTYGDVLKAEEVRVGYLPQDQMQLSWAGEQTTLLEAVTHGEKLEESAADLLAAIEAYGVEDPRAREAESQFNMEGGYLLPRHMHGFGLSHLPYNHLFADLSGGEKSKLALIRLFLGEYDLLVLDEPTNHLDTNAICWLEKFLRKTKDALVLVSHDRMLLQQISRDICELDSLTGGLTRFKGNYEEFLARKQAAFARQLQQYQQQSDQEQQLTASAKDMHTKARQHKPSKRDNFKIGFNARGQRSQKSTSTKIKRQKQALEAIKRDRIERPEDVLRVSWQSHSAKIRPSGSLRVSGLNVQYDGRLVIQDCTLTVGVGERVVLKGLNGSGKSSILRAIINNHAAVNTDGLVIGYMPQENIGIDMTLDVKEYFQQQVSMNDIILTMSLEQIMIVYCALPPASLHRPLSELSMGQISRLKLALAFLKAPDILILDEPTNHLDISSAEHLENQISQFPGGVLVVSHDRRFIENFRPDRIYEIAAGKCTLIPSAQLTPARP